MEFSANQLAQLLEGTVDGNSNITVNRLSKIEEGTEGSLTFLANPKYTHFIYETNASIVIIAKDFIPEKRIKSTLIRVDNPYASFTKLLEIYNNLQNVKIGIEQPSFIPEGTIIGENAYIGAFSYLGKNVTLGNNCKVYPNAYIGDNVVIGNNSILNAGVKIYNDCVIGNNCILHAGVVIGSDGFGYSVDNNNIYTKVPQTGNVIIGNNVEIGANSTVDRATLGSTIIRDGVKLDNLIQIAHNVEIGENTVIAAQAGVAGSSKLGKNLIVGGQVGIAGHLKIADNVKIQAQSGVASNIEKEGEAVQGSPAIQIMNFKKSYIYFKKLPSLLNKITSE